MDVKLAKSAGFCFGVERAVNTVYEQIQNGNIKIYTYGPIIHNDEVIKELAEKGVKVIKTEEELLALKEGTVIIRSHGVPKYVYDKIRENGLDLIDATCPYVKKIHKIAERESENQRKILIVGNEKHPEVEGIIGWSKSNSIVISSKEEAKELNLPMDEKLCIIVQTTFNYNNFQDIVEIISKKGYDIIVLNTICKATQERQLEAKEIAGQVDAMIVIGDKKSSNTQKLYEICKNECENNYYIQALVDLDLEALASMCSVGITAGASTPNNIIEEVHTNVRVKF
ncbi:MAG: 4-hydroxy-3-methylbut-2-enyl diphosphate reductase [Clostridiales bacterium]|nr:4-hydroxy-3-methylbut-2-enyl diphosphate reductase [Clostridiales bacterium]